jgi:hypothetical protein
MQRWVRQNINAEKDKAELDFLLILSSVLSVYIWLPQSHKKNLILNNNELFYSEFRLME